MLYHFMIEILRNPEDLRNMTGSMLEHRLKICRDQETKGDDTKIKRKDRK